MELKLNWYTDEDGDIVARVADGLLLLNVWSGSNGWSWSVSGSRQERVGKARGERSAKKAAEAAARIWLSGALVQVS